MRASLQNSPAGVSNVTGDERRVANVRMAINLAGCRIVADGYGRKTPCVYCGGKQESRDHVIPVSRGGSNTLANLVPCCDHCNTMKRDLLPQDFFSAHPRLAYRFAIHAVHAHEAIREIARNHGKRYGATKAFFDGVDDEPSAAPGAVEALSPATPARV